MTILGDKIKYYRIKNGLTLIKLAELSNVGQSTINDIETGKAKNPKMRTLVKLAESLKVDVNEFFDYSYPLEYGDLEKFDNNMVKESAAVYGAINFDKSDIKNIPIVGVVRAGKPILAQENIEGYQPTLKNTSCSDKDYFYLRVQGDSMNQKFDNGDLLLIEKSQFVENGSIAVVLIDGMEATVKKIIRNDNMITLIPMSNNPKYIPKMYDLTKERVEIIGEAIEVIKKLR